MIFESIGVSKGLFGFLLIAVALTAFIVTSIIEKRVNGEKVSLHPNRNIKMAVLTGIAFVIGFTIIFMQDSKSRALAKVSGDGISDAIEELQLMSIDELAIRLIERDRTIQVIDVRSAEEFKEGNIPTSFNIPLDSLANDEWRKALRQEGKSNTFYSNDMKLSGQAAVLSQLLKDNKDIYILEGGWVSFKTNILEADASQQTNAVNGNDTQRFRIRAKDEMAELANEAGHVPQPEKKRKKAKGGC